MPQNFQNAALALLLCAPSTLHRKWTENDAAGCAAELARLAYPPTQSRLRKRRWRCCVGTCISSSRSRRC
jgi:hypothetical protein